MASRASLLLRGTPVYERHRPETTALYEVVRDNLETLYGAIEDGALDVRIPKHAKKELDAYLDCGLLCRGFARLYCGACDETRLVAFSCKGRGFCPSCCGRRMCSTSANLIDYVLPEVGLRQWVLTFPFPWRRRLAQDGALFADLTRLFVETVQAFYANGASARGAKTGSITVVQRTSSDLRLNPHLHVLFLDGAYHEAAIRSEPFRPSVLSAPSSRVRRREGRLRCQGRKNVSRREGCLARQLHPARTRAPALAMSRAARLCSATCFARRSPRSASKRVHTASSASR